MPSMGILFFALALVSSSYSLVHGYIQIYRHGLKNIEFFLYCVAIFISVMLSFEVVLFGSMSAHINFLPASFSPWYNSLIYPSFSFLIIFQTIYFFSESIVVSIRSIQTDQHVLDWYVTIYLLALSLNSAAMLLGLFFIENMLVL